MSESKTTFFRQSGWLVIANTLCGVFMIAVHPFASTMSAPEEYSLFLTLLRLFMILAIPAAGLQTVLAKQAAAAITPERQRDLAATVRSILSAILIFWLVVAIVFGLLSPRIVNLFQLSNADALLITLLVVLAELCRPVMQGLAQGVQNFQWLGWSLILNGLGRVVSIALLVSVLGLLAGGAMAGALIGLGLSVFIAWWPVRALILLPGGKVDWHEWMAQVIPLSLGTGSVVFLLNADMLFVQSNFPKDVTPLYGAGAMVGVGIVTFTAPMAWVMFPKLARSFALAERSNALYLAAGGTAILGAIAALLSALLPELPVRILFLKRPEFWKASVLVPWFAIALVPVTMANVLIGDLLARGRFKIVPWLTLIAIGYGLTLFWFTKNPEGVEALEAFRQIVKILSLFSLLTLVTSILFTWWDRRPSSNIKV